KTPHNPATHLRLPHPATVGPGRLATKYQPSPIHRDDRFESFEDVRRCSWSDRYIVRKSKSPNVRVHHYGRAPRPQTCDRATVTTLSLAVDARCSSHQVRRVRRFSSRRATINSGVTKRRAFGERY